MLPHFEQRSISTSFIAMVLYECVSQVGQTRLALDGGYSETLWSNVSRLGALGDVVRAVEIEAPDNQIPSQYRQDSAPKKSLLSWLRFSRHWGQVRGIALAIRVSGGFERILISKPKYCNNLALSNFVWAFDKEATRTNSDALLVERPSLCVDNKHQCLTFERDFTLRKDGASRGDELRPNHTNSIHLRVIAFIQEIPTGVLMWRRLAAAFHLREKAITNFKIWPLACALSVGSHGLYLVIVCVV